MSRGGRALVELRADEIQVTPLRGMRDPLRATRASLPPREARASARARSTLPARPSPALELCLAPYTLEQFAAYWGQRPLHIRRRGEADRFRHLLSMERLDALLSARVVPPGTIFVFNARSVREAESLPASWLGDDFAVTEASLNFHFLDQFSPALHAFCDELEGALGLSTAVFAFLNPPEAQARRLHWDPLDVFVLQLEGEKVWDLHEPLIPSPLGQHDHERYHLDTRRIARVVLKPGDTLYVPRGVIHKAESVDELSLSITIGVFPLTWERLIRTASARALQVTREHRRLRQPLRPSSRGAVADWIPRLDAWMSLTRQIATPSLLRECAVNEPRGFDGPRFHLQPGQVASAYLDEASLAEWTFTRTSAPYVLEARGDSWQLAQRGHKTRLSSGEAACLRWMDERGHFRLPELPARLRKLDVRGLLWRLLALGLIIGGRAQAGR